MKKLLCVSFLILFLYGLYSNAEVIYVSGDVWGTWSADTVIVTNEVRVPPDSTLIIEPGVKVLFQAYCKFIVDNNAALLAVGTEADTILFDEYITGNHWKGIRFLNASDSCRLEYCHLTNGYASGGFPDDCGGAIYCLSSSPVITNCVISGNSTGAGGSGGGIFCSYSSPSITNCAISGNTANWGGGIFCDSSSPSITSCAISGNTAGWDGGGIFCFSSSSSITSCAISGNTAYYGGGISCYYSSPSITNCAISGNTADNSGGIYCVYSSPAITNCTISGNTAGYYGGGGIYCFSSSPDILNTIVEGNLGSYGIYWSGSSSGSSITYSDFHNNQVGNFYNPPQLVGQIITVNANSDSCDLWMNIFEDPLFYSTAGDSAYYLTAASPCIDAGDPNSPLDPDSTIADIGCYYFDQDTSFQQNLSGELPDTLYPGIYIIIDDIFISVGGSTVIMPACTLLFDGYYRFDINGLLKAEGDSANNIIFDCTSSEIYFAGIFFNATADSSTIIKYCLISNHGFDAPQTAYAIYCTGSNPYIYIDNCEITGSGGPLSNGGIMCDDASPTISECFIYGNGGEHGAGIFTLGTSAPSISKCLLVDNGGYWGCGIYCCSNPIIDRCTIINDSILTGGGIYCDWGANPEIKNTLIYGENNTYGIYFQPPNGSVQYCDIYVPVYPFFGNPPSGLGVLNTININGDSCDVFYNIFEDPLFVDLLNGNYNLSWEHFFIHDSTMSPCIDAGDPASPLDPDNTTADIGRFYFNQFGPWPNILLSAYELNFPETVVGDIAQLDLVIYNTGNGDLILDTLEFSLAVFTSNFSPDTLAHEDSLVLTITFTPPAITTYAGTMTIISNDYPAVVDLFGGGVGPVSVVLTPLNPPIIIPDSGGVFDFNIAAENLTANTQNFDVWTQIFLPGTGSIEIISVTGLSLAGNASVNRDRTQNVPDFAPAGSYYYYGYTGEYPWVIEDYDYFTFTKEGADGDGYLGTVDDWLCTGEPFDGEIITTPLPEKYALHPAFPNPFNPKTTIRFDLPEAGNILLAVYDITGREVVRLAEGFHVGGYYEKQFDGLTLASGVYFARLKTDGFSKTRKLLLIK